MSSAAPPGTLICSSTLIASWSGRSRHRLRVIGPNAARAAVLESTTRTRLETKTRGATAEFSQIATSRR